MGTAVVCMEGTRFDTRERDRAIVSSASGPAKTLAEVSLVSTEPTAWRIVLGPVGGSGCSDRAGSEETDPVAEKTVFEFPGLLDELNT